MMKTRQIVLLAAVSCAIAPFQPLFAQTAQKPSTNALAEDRDDANRRANVLSQEADRLYASGDPIGAVPLQAEALRLRSAALGKRHPETIRDLNNYAFTLNAAGRSAEAERVFAEALRLSREVLGERHSDTIRSLNNYASVLQALGRHGEAEPMFADVLRLSREMKGDRHPDTITSLNNYASVLQEMGRPIEAEPLFAEALRLRREVLGEVHPDTLEALNNYAVVLRALGRSAEAEPLLSQALRSIRELRGERHPATLFALNNHAAVLRSLGRVAEAEPLYADALRISREVLNERHPFAILALNNYAFAIQELGRAAEAEPLLADVLRLNREQQGERHPDTLLALNNYASVLLDLGRADEAEPIYAEALRLRREIMGDRHSDTLASLNNYAFVLQDLGRGDESEPLFAEALRLRREVQGDRHPDTIASLNNYAFVLAALNRSAEAEPLYAEALRLSREVLGDRHPTTISAMNNHASALQRLGLVAQAEPLFAQALRLRRETMGDHHPDTLISLNNYAFVLRAQGRTGEAKPLFAEALRLSRAVLGDSHPNTLGSMNNLAVTLMEMDQADQALPLARELAATTRSRAVDLGGDNLRGTLQRDRELSDRQAVERFLADVLWANVGDAQLNQQALRAEAFTALQLSSAGSTTRAVAEAAASRFASGLGLQQLVQGRQSLTRNWIEIEAALVESEAGGGAASDDRDALRIRLGEVEARIGEIDQRLAHDAPQYFAILNQQAVGLEQIREILDADEALLFLVPTRLGTISMAVTRDEIVWANAEINEYAIEAEIADFRMGLEIKGGDPNLPLFNLNQAYELYTQLIAPVESALQNASRVYVIADGDLSRLPLATLVVSQPAVDSDADDPEVLRGTDWLADRYALVQLPSLQSLFYIRSFGAGDEPEDGVGFTGFGAPVLGGEARLRGARSATLAPVDASQLVSTMRGSAGERLMEPAALRRLSALPGTRLELEKVRAALGAPENMLYLGDRMTETAIRNTDLSHTHILHLATHGFISEESGFLAEPGLVFTPPDNPQSQDDGYLAASEIVGLDLSSANWVILSACNTASPSGRPGETGLTGLAQAFFYAGAESLLVSHWPVFDDIAPVLTLESLKRSQNGEPRAEALQQAMHYIRKAPELDAAHPAVWAPFILVGEGR